MKVRFVFEISDDDRKALAKHYGDSGKATRATVRAWIDATLNTTLAEISDGENDHVEGDTQ